MFTLAATYDLLYLQSLSPKCQQLHEMQLHKNHTVSMAADLFFSGALHTSTYYSSELQALHSAAYAKLLWNYHIS